MRLHACSQVPVPRYSAIIPPDTATLTFHPCPSQVRYIVYHESLWRVSAHAFNAVVPAGLPALAAAATAGEDTAASWEALADAFETFLLVRRCCLRIMNIKQFGWSSMD